MGNNTTKEDIILRELTFTVGDSIKREDLAFNRERVYSLGIFTNVKLSAHRIDNKNSILIAVNESWYIWPIPFVNLQNSDFKKLTYGMNLLYRNFRGRNETLSLSFGLGYDPFLSMYYYTPLLFRKENIFLSTGFVYQDVFNKSLIAKRMYGDNFEINIISYNLSVGKRINLYNELAVNTGFDYISIPKNLPELTASGTRIDRVPKLGVNYTFDTRNLKQFPDSGIFASVNYLYRGFGFNNIDYSGIKLDFRHYLKIIGYLTGKWRAAARFTFGKTIPFYDHSYLGVDETIRGHQNDVREGNHMYIGSAEVKYPIIREWNFKIKLPLIPEQLTSYRIAIFTNAFVNTGAVHFRNQPLSFRSFYSGYGAGLIFLILPYNIFRIELALDEYKNKELIFDLGFSF